MIKTLILSILLISSSVFATDMSDCHSLMLAFIHNTHETVKPTAIQTSWTINQSEAFLEEIKALGFDEATILKITTSLKSQKEELTPERVKNYLMYVLSLGEKKQSAAISELSELDRLDSNSKYIKEFIAHEEKIQKHIIAKDLTSTLEQERYQELYYGCRSMTPNKVNQNAAKDFKRFNLALNLSSLAASYAVSNSKKEINTEWFEKLGYDVGMTVMFSYVGSNIQTKATDTQIVKSLKGYFMGRVMGLTDVIVYDPLFNQEQNKAIVRVEELKKDPFYKTKIDSLLKTYNERNIYRKYKNEIINSLKKLPHNISLGLKGKSIDENNIDWNNITHADLDRPEVQEVLVAAAMAQVYNESKGQWLSTGDAGLDRYAFNTAFFALQIPKSIAQNFITYRLLCMGQDNAKLSFFKAAVFNVSTSFFVNQMLYGYRQKAINQ